MPKITQNSVTDQVVAFLRNNIEKGIWKPSDKISSENELTEELGVSRASVRYAIQQLVAIGVLETHQGKGTYVKAALVHDLQSRLKEIYNNSEIDDLLEYRNILEVESCRLAAERISPEAIIRLQEFLNGMKEGKTNREKFVFNDSNFHKEILAATGNNLIIRSLKLILKQMVNFQEELNTDELMDWAIEYHSKILNAFQNKDGQDAAHWMKVHLNAVQEEYHRLRGEL